MGTSVLIVKICQTNDSEWIDTQRDIYVTLRALHTHIIRFNSMQARWKWTLPPQKWDTINKIHTSLYAGGHCFYRCCCAHCIVVDRRTMRAISFSTVLTPNTNHNHYYRALFCWSPLLLLVLFSFCPTQHSSLMSSVHSSTISFSCLLWNMAKRMQNLQHFWRASIILGQSFCPILFG